jgi:hypothetical protein
MGWRTFAKIALLIATFAAAGLLAGVLTGSP